MDTLTMSIVAALVCAIILSEINKRERAKITNFFNGDKISLLIDADEKVKAILNIINNTSGNYLNDSTRQYLSGQLTSLTHNYENNDMTLTDYHAALDQLLGNQFSLPQWKDNYSVNY